MTVGKQTWEGGAIPLYGESEMIQQTAATDILTITGATSQSGDFVVCRDVDGSEKFALTSSGALTLAKGLTVGTMATFTLASTLAEAAVLITPTSTGAIAAFGYLANGVLVQASSKSVINSAFAYRSTGDATTCNHLLGVYGSVTPTYFLGMTGSGATAATWIDGGFVETGLFLVSALATTVAITALKVVYGDSVLYIPLLTTTSLAAS